jgi:SAM-dependent methyltransferase
MGDLAIGYLGYNLLRNWVSNPNAVAESVAEIRSVLAEMDACGPLSSELGMNLQEVDAGYREWAVSYDTASNPFSDLARSQLPTLFQSIAAPEGRLLDIGAGPAPYTDVLSNLGHDVVAMDRSCAMLDGRPDGLVSVLGDALHLPFQKGAFTVAFSSLVACHIADLGLFFAEQRRILRPGGVAICADIHPHAIRTGAGGVFRGADGSFRVIPLHRRHVSDYVTSLASAQLEFGGLAELTWGRAPVSGGLLGASNSALSRPHFQSGEPGVLVIWGMCR